MSLWRVSEAGPVPVHEAAVAQEKNLEDWLVSDPTILGTQLLLIGRQVATSFGGFIDILAIDADARVHVLELKRDKTPREVVAQLLDYASWVRQLTQDDLASIFSDKVGGDLAQAFAEFFPNPFPDVVNADQQLTIVAAALDPASERIVEFLADEYGVPINAIFFRMFQDGGNQYLGRTWLIDPGKSAASPARVARGKIRPWNGTDFYVVQGRVEENAYRWELARTTGYLTAGGGSWYTKPLRNLVPGKRVFAYVGGAGYVAMGTVAGHVLPVKGITVTKGDTQVPLADAWPGVPDEFRSRVDPDDPDLAEMAVRVEWDKTLPLNEAIREAGMFSSQVTVCKLRDEPTLTVLYERFGVLSES
jgi:hypothetical protein